MASFRSQYGFRLATDLPTMKWREFAAYMSGLDGKSPLGRVISIRAEDDREILAQFTPEQKRMRNEWRSRKAKKMPKADVNAVLAEFKRMFIGMAGGMTEKDQGEQEADGKDAKTDLS